MYRKLGKIKPSTAKVAGKNALIFARIQVHTQLDEATPAGKTMRLYFEHFVFSIVGVWYVVGEFQGRLDIRTQAG